MAKLSQDDIKNVKGQGFLITEAQRCFLVVYCPAMAYSPQKK